MPIVTFWSSTKRETAQTLSMLAIACHMAVENNTKILIIDTNFNDPTIQNAFFPEQDSSTRKTIKLLNKGKLDIGSGIEGLSKLLASGKTSGEVITDYSKVIYKGRLEAILSYTPEDEMDEQRVKQTYKDLVKIAGQQYDYVFVDVAKGFDDQTTNDILNLSQVIIYNLTQRQRDINEYVKLKMENPLFKSGKVLPLIGRYDRYSKYTKKNIARDVGEKKEIPAVSYNTLFFENANEGQIGNYFLKFRKSLISSNDRNAVFIDEVANAADRLVFKAQEVLMMG